jgi:hypothetical protein
MDYLYHSSKISGLKTIEPRVSTHGQPWIYAMEKPEYCLMFMGNHSDLVNQTGFSNGLPFIAERFEGSLEYAYENTKGSIYTLDGADFKSGMTTFSPEFVCGHTCQVIAEEVIDNALQAVLKLESEGKIKIFKYGSAISWMPADKSDLIEKVVGWAKSPESKILEEVKKFHPDILDEVMRRLKNK